MGCSEEGQAETLALRWSGEQVEGAQQALRAARSALQDLKAIEKKRQQKVHFDRLLPVFVLPWQPCA